MRKNIEKKKKQVEELASEIKGHSVVGSADISGLPNRQFQNVRKKLRGQASFKVAKKSVLTRAVKESGKAVELIEQIKEQSAIFISQSNPFDLFRKISSVRTKLAAKPGQISPEDIVVPAGETTLAPGPVLTELKNAGINAKIDKGKIAIMKDAVVAKKGEPISDSAAKVLQILGIKPFEAKMKIRAIWEDGILYHENVLNVDIDEFRKDVVACARNGFNMTFNIAYATPMNAGLLLQKAHREALSVGIEANVYSPATMNHIISKAHRVAASIKGKVG